MGRANVREREAECWKFLASIYVHGSNRRVRERRSTKLAGMSCLDLRARVEPACTRETEHRIGGSPLSRSACTGRTGVYERDGVPNRRECLASIYVSEGVQHRAFPDPARRTIMLMLNRTAKHNAERNKDLGSERSGIGQGGLLRER